MVHAPSFSQTKWKLRGRFVFSIVGMAALAYLALLSVAVALSLRYEVNLYENLLTLGFAFTFGMAWSILQWVVSPIFMDFAIGWTFGVDRFEFSKLRDSPLPMWFVDFLERKVEQTGIGIKKVLVLKDETMNAFVYGHGHWNGRLAISAGLFKYLNEEELKAVVGHELSHVKNNDFIMLTVVTGFPLFTAYCYSFLRQIASHREGIKAGVAYPFILGLAIFTRFLYILSMLFLLSLTRTREAMADFGSVLTYGSNPQSLSTALMKVGYGLLDITEQGDEEVASKFLPPQIEFDDKEKENEHRMKKATPKETGNVLNTLGFMAHFSSPTPLYGQGSRTPEERVNRVLKWERTQPMAKVLRLFSSHPLVSDRIEMMDDLAMELGHPPILSRKVNFKSSSFLQPYFLKDMMFFVANLTFWSFVFVGAYALLGLGSLPLYVRSGIMGAVALTFGIYVLWYAKSAHSFNFQKTTINEILEADEKSPLFRTGLYVRRPVKVEGRVMGRLMPGFKLDHNFVIEENGETMVALWETLTIIGQLQFAIFDLPDFENAKVRIKGWLSRVPVPVLRVYEIEAIPDSGWLKTSKKKKSWLPWAVYGVAATAFFIAFVMLFWAYGFFITGL